MAQITCTRISPGNLVQRLTLIALLALLALVLPLRAALGEEPQIAPGTPQLPSPRPISPISFEPSVRSTLSPEEMGDLHMAHRRYQAAIEAYNQTLAKTSSIWNKIGMAKESRQNKLTTYFDIGMSE